MRGLQWFNALSANATPVEGLPGSLKVADGVLGEQAVRYIAVASPAYLQGLPKPPGHPLELGRQHGVACITLGYGDFQSRLQWLHGQDRSPARRQKCTIHD